MRWIVLSCLAGLAVSCGAAPRSAVDDFDEAQIRQTMELRYAMSWNLHADFGAMDRRRESKVVLDLAAGGAARLVDEGEYAEGVLDNRWGRKDELTRWRNVWIGSWSEQEDGMLLELRSAFRECEQSSTDYGGAPATTDCPGVPAAVSLECIADQVMAGPDPACSEQDKQAHAVWICHASAGNPDLGGSPLSWVFGTEACLEISGGPLAGPRVYSVC
jgi:hypothetical protein